MFVILVFILILVGMVKQPTSESSEFTMSSEDFPALPGTASTEGPSPGSSVVSSSEKSVSQTGSSEVSTQQQDLVNSRLAMSNDKTQALKRGIQTSPDGMKFIFFNVTNKIMK